jgi:hypothetical protein
MNTSDWLIGFAQKKPTEEEKLASKVEQLNSMELTALINDLDPSTIPSQMDEMSEKIASAERMGRELARERGDELEKTALLPLLEALPALASAAGKSLVSGAAKGVVSSGMNAAKSSLGTSGSAGGFKYAGVMDSATKALGGAFKPGGFGHKATSFLAAHPGAGLTLAGAGVGAMMAPRDPETGQKQYLRGALTGGGLAAGANALTQGRLADKALGAVTRSENPLLGKRVAEHMRGVSSGGTPAFAHAASPTAAAGATPHSMPAAERSSVHVDPSLMREADRMDQRHNAILNQGAGGGGSVTSPGTFGSKTHDIPSGGAVSGEIGTAPHIQQPVGPSLGERAGNFLNSGYSNAKRWLGRLGGSPGEVGGAAASGISSAGGE